MYETALRKEPRLLRALGIAGWDHLEPVILAALATESPLLLIGPHGSAKTLILTRLAEALGLAHRHYNASLLNFDDLVGFPIPDNGRLLYLQTPATIWDAESVLFDEISRCRPELQNKLFPIVHEKIVQGIALDKLRHRWGAMNPPPAADGTSTTARPTPAPNRSMSPWPIASASSSGAVARRPEAQRSTDRVEGSSRPLMPRHACRAVGEIRQGLPAAASALQRAAADYVQILAMNLATRIIRCRRAGRSSWPQHQRGHCRDERRGGRVVGPARTPSTWPSATPPDEGWGAPVLQTTLLTAHRRPGSSRSSTSAAR